MAEVFGSEEVGQKLPNLKVKGLRASQFSNVNTIELLNWINNSVSIFDMQIKKDCSIFIFFLMYLRV